MVVISLIDLRPNFIISFVLGLNSAAGKVYHTSKIRTESGKFDSDVNPPSANAKLQAF